MKNPYKLLTLACYLFLGSLMLSQIGRVLAQPVDIFDELLPMPGGSYIDFGEGEVGIRELIIYYARVFKNLVAVLTVLFIVIAGIRMITAGGAEETVQKNRKSIIWLLVGLVIMQSAETFVYVLYGYYGLYDTRLDAAEYAQNAREKLLEPLLSFFLTFIAAIAVFMVVLSGMRILSSVGDEGKIKKQTSVLLGAIMGLLIILLARPIVSGIFGYERPDPQPTQIISLITQLANYIMGFTALLAIVMLIYAGILMIMHFGNDAMIQKARKIVIWALLGVALIISAYTIVVLFILPTLA